MSGAQGGLKLVLYFRDEETVAGKGEGDIVKAKPKRGYPWDEE